MRRFIGAALLLLTALGAAVPALAERAETYGDYQIHYNALPTATLLPEIAKAYGITRSKERGLLNIVILKHGTPIHAQVQAQAVNLSNQLKTINMRGVTEQDAVYYLGEFQYNDGDTLDFTVKVRPEGASREYTVQFRQQFFVEGD